MNWELFYLICFVVGFAFTALSFLSGTLHLHFHLPGHGHIHLGGHSGGHGATQGGGHGAQHAGHAHGGHFPFFNPMSIAVFLAWFGGTGYLLVHLRHIWVFAGLALASLAGFTGAALVFLFVGKFLMGRDYTLDPADFEMVGVLGKVSDTVRNGGTGEIIYEQLGLRKACAARSEAGEDIQRGEEVIVTRFDNGVAYVRRWSELAEKAGVLPEEEERSS
ncbi:MAG TPA: NfeD family protein [Terriglobales bacterium]|nr:NfeD family protein [Terriglobales bacterium]